MTNFKEDILQITTRLIVEEGFNYSEAKQKAGSILKPNRRQKTKLNNFPTNLEIEKSVKEYLHMYYRNLWNFYGWACSFGQRIRVYGFWL